MPEEPSQERLDKIGKKLQKEIKTENKVIEEAKKQPKGQG